MRQSFQQEEFAFTERKTTRRKIVLSLRAARLVIVGSVIVLAACQDATAPEPTIQRDLAPMMSQAAASPLAQLGASLDDMTGWSMSAMRDAVQQAKLQGTLGGLKGHLNSGKVALIQQDVTAARSVLESLDIVSQVELGQVGLALDVVQAELNKTSK